MKKIFLSFIFLWSFCSCENQFNSTESYAVFNKMKSEYISKKFDEKKYLDKWINVPFSSKKVDFIFTKEEESVIYKNIKEFYPKAFYVGIVQLEKFKIYSYEKEDKEKRIEKKVKISNTIKGIVSKNMTFDFYMEPSNTYFPEDEMQKHIIFLFKEKNLIYEDAFLSFPNNHTINKMIQTIKKCYELSISNLKPEKTCEENN